MPNFTTAQHDKESMLRTGLPFTSVPVPPRVKYEGKIPKTLRDYADKHADRVEAVSHGSGYATDNGFSYEVWLRVGWEWDSCHQIIESTVARILACLRAVERGTCDECEASRR